MHDSLLRIDREEGVFVLLIFVIMLWILSCIRSGKRKESKRENVIKSDFTETFNFSKFPKNFTTSFQTKKHLS